MTEWIRELIEQGGYLGVALLMVLENVFPPIPSTVVLPLAGYTAANGELNLAGVVAASCAGSLVGALFWYGLGRWLGQERLERWASRHGRWLTMTPAEIESASGWFQRRGAWTVLVGRWVPTVRTLVAIPAGVFALPLVKFVPLVLLGTLGWEGGLAVAGYALGGDYEQVDRYLGPIALGCTVVAVLVYVYRVIRFDPREAAG